VFVHARTQIGFGSNKANSGAAHGAALGQDEVDFVKATFGFDPTVKCYVPSAVYDYYKDVAPTGVAHEEAWNKTYAEYAKAHPDLHAELEQRLTGSLPTGWKDSLPAKSALPTAAQPTRKSSGIVVQALVPQYKHFTSGSADLEESTFVNFKGQVDFQNVRAFLVLRIILG